MIEFIVLSYESKLSGNLEDDGVGVVMWNFLSQ